MRTSILNGRSQHLDSSITQVMLRRAWHALPFHPPEQLHALARTLASQQAAARAKAQPCHAVMAARLAFHRPHGAQQGSAAAAAGTPCCCSCPPARYLWQPSCCSSSAAMLAALSTLPPTCPHWKRRWACSCCCCSGVRRGACASGINGKHMELVIGGAWGRKGGRTRRISPAGCYSYQLL